MKKYELSESEIKDISENVATIIEATKQQLTAVTEDRTILALQAKQAKILHEELLAVGFNENTAQDILMASLMRGNK